MPKKHIFMFLALAFLGGIYVVYFTDIFQKKEMQITSKIRPEYARRTRSGSAPKPQGNIISFSLNDKYKLTSVRVVEESDLKTNKYPRALWHLITESNSIPTKSIIYGVTVQGMKPKVAKVKPETLRTNVPYVLLLEARDVKGQTTFRMR